MYNNTCFSFCPAGSHYATMKYTFISEKARTCIDSCTPLKTLILKTGLYCNNCAKYRNLRDTVYIKNSICKSNQFFDF